MARLPYRDHDEAMAELFRDDPAFAAEYLDSVAADGDPAELMVALRHVVNARVGVKKAAQLSELNPKTLYRTLSDEGNPELRSLLALLNTLGLRLSFAAKPTPRAAKRTRA
jgi:probable addiction module antidote protein